MAAQTGVNTGSGQSLDFEAKVQKQRDIYADVSDFSKTALENVIPELRGTTPTVSTPQTTVLGGIGARRARSRR
jgi:hypothetical protein